MLQRKCCTGKCCTGHIVQASVVQKVLYSKKCTEDAVHKTLHRKGCTGNVVQVNVVQEFAAHKINKYIHGRCVVIVGFQ